MSNLGQKALFMPELLEGVLRCLGPLDWLKCSAVCPWWSAAILGPGHGRRRHRFPRSSTPVGETDANKAVESATITDADEAVRSATKTASNVAGGSATEPDAGKAARSATESDAGKAVGSATETGAGKASGSATETDADKAVGSATELDADKAVESATEEDADEAVGSATETAIDEAARSATEPDAGKAARSATQPDAGKDVRSATEAGADNAVGSATKPDFGKAVGSATETDADKAVESATEEDADEAVGSAAETASDEAAGSALAIETESGKAVGSATESTTENTVGSAIVTEPDSGAAVGSATASNVESTVGSVTEPDVDDAVGLATGSDACDDVKSSTESDASKVVGFATETDVGKAVGFVTETDADDAVGSATTKSDVDDAVKSATESDADKETDADKPRRSATETYAGKAVEPEKATETTDLSGIWRDFAETTMRFGQGDTRCRELAPFRTTSFYKSVCLEGDPTVLGRRFFLACHGSSWTLQLIRDVFALSEARYRNPWVLLIFLNFWIGHEQVGEATDDVHGVRMLLGITKYQKVLPGFTELRWGKQKTELRPKQSKRLYARAMTVTLNDALGAFTRLLVICRRCRRPRTTLCFSQFAELTPPSRTGNAGEQRSGRKRKAEISWTLMDRAIAIWVECQEKGCGAKSRVVVDHASPRWLRRFARMLLFSPWNEINTIRADEGTEGFSDTPPKVALVWLREESESLLDPDALLRRRNLQRGRSLYLGEYVYHTRLR